MRRLRAAEQLRTRDGDARLHARPPGDRQGRARRPPRVLRPRRSAGCCRPGRPLPADYAAALAQRNAALKRGDRDALAPWTAQVASLGAALVELRSRLLGLLEPPFAESAGALGLPDARLGYEGDPPTEAPRGPPRPRPGARIDGPRPAPARRRRSPPPAATCARSARRASSGRPCSRCSSPSGAARRAARRAAAAAPRRRALGARPGRGAACWSSRSRAAARR